MSDGNSNNGHFSLDHLPDGVQYANTVEAIMNNGNDAASQRNSLEASQIKERIDAYIKEVAQDIILDLNQGLIPELIFPLLGGVFFYWLLMDELEKQGVAIDDIEVRFAGKDANNNYELSPRQKRYTENTRIRLCDDIYDSGDSSKEILGLIQNEVVDAGSVKLEYMSTKQGTDFKPERNIFVTPAAWIYSCFGMNSNQVKGALEILERLSAVPLMGSNGLKLSDIDPEAYRKSLEQLNYFQAENIYQHPLFKLLQKLLQQPLENQFRYILDDHFFRRSAFGIAKQRHTIAEQ